jgi:hypothetical protein
MLTLTDLPCQTIAALSRQTFAALSQQKTQLCRVGKSLSLFKLSNPDVETLLELSPDQSRCLSLLELLPDQMPALC